MMNRTNLKPQQIKDNLYLLFQSALKSAIKGLFNDIEKKIFFRAEHTEDPAIKLDLFNQLEVIKKKGIEFEEIFFDLILKPIDDQPDKNWLDSTEDRNLALQIEDMISHAKAKYGVEHAQFESRINWLFINFPEHFSNKIFTLNFLVHRFLDSSKIFEKPLKDQVIRSLGNQVLYKLEPLYTLMNESLIQFGIITEVKSNKKTPSSSHASSLIQELNNNEQLLNKELDDSTLVPTEEIINFIQRCIKNKHHVMSKKSDWTANEFVNQYTHHLIQSTKHGQLNRKISNTDHNILESIGSILSAIINKKAINPVIKNKIIEMQSIFLMMAFSCPTFMNQPNHSARVALTKISSIGTNPNLSLSTLNEVANIFANFIDSISDDYEQDFKALNTHLDKLEMKAQLPESKISPPEEFKHLNEIKQRSSDLVIEIISKQTAGAIISTPAKEFIDNTLSGFLIDALIRQGRQSPAWLDANNLLSMIIHFEANLATNAEKSKLNIEPLVDLVKGFENANKYGQFIERNATAAYINYLNDLNLDITKTDSIRSSPALSQSSSSHPVNSGLTTQQPLDFASTSTVAKSAPPIPISSEHSLFANSEETQLEPVEPSDDFSQVIALINQPAVSLFSAKHIFNNEWFKVFISQDLPLRTLKPTKVDTASLTTIFSNKNGVITLTLPAGQFFQDIFNRRSHPVFESSSYAHDLNKLAIELKNQGFIL
jgi:hypothetical protein